MPTSHSCLLRGSRPTSGYSGQSSSQFLLPSWGSNHYLNAVAWALGLKGADESAFFRTRTWSKVATRMSQLGIRARTSAALFPWQYRLWITTRAKFKAHPIFARVNTCSMARLLCCMARLCLGARVLWAATVCEALLLFTVTAAKL